MALPAPGLDELGEPPAVLVDGLHGAVGKIDPGAGHLQGDQLERRGGGDPAERALVVGDQDVQKLAGHNKSSKHRKAEDLILKGQPIRILRESDFLELAGLVD